MTKPPAYLNYAKDWLVDTGHLTLEEQGAYKRLMDHQWLNTPLPKSEPELARLLGVSMKRFARIWDRIRKFFPPVEGGFANPRLEVERAKQVAFRALQRLKGQRGARSRWDGTGHAPAIAPAMPVPQPNDGFAVSSFQRNTKSKTKTPRARRAERPNWVTELGKAWGTAYHGTPPWARIGEALKPFVESHGFDEVARRWAKYLAETDAEYASPTRFAQTFGRWDGGGGKKTPQTYKYEASTKAPDWEESA